MKTQTLFLIICWFSVNVYGQIGFENHIVVDDTYVAKGARTVSTADLDGDGDLDVLSASRSDNKIAWYENIDGLGTFSLQKAIPYYVRTATSAHAADIDGDGDMDILCTSDDRDYIAWFENLDGLGNFSGEPQYVSQDVDGAEFVSTTDIDGDGDLDVISASSLLSHGNIAWYENTNGLGDFGEKQVISLDGNAMFVTADDIDGDGDMDILGTQGGIGWYENIDGLGSFSNRNSISAPAPGIRAESASLTDIDGDGDLDVVTTSYNSSVTWYENEDGQGDFGEKQIISDQALGVKSVFSADIDNDGDMDVLSTSYNEITSNHKVAWYENIDGLGIFSEQQIISTTALGAVFVSAADIDNDGDMDVLSASKLDHKIAWYENEDGLGSFSDELPLTPYLAILPTDVYANDIDGDGDIDILSVSSDDDKIAWYENMNGLGDFSTEKIITTNADWARAVDGGDIDGDGDVDILSASSNDDKIAWYENTNGLGVFGAEQIIAIDVEGAYFVKAIDIDNDGDLDVLSGSRNDDEIIWYENTDGLGNFSLEKLVSDNANIVTSIGAADIDSDGDVDVFAAIDDDENNDQKIVWYENMDGFGNFSVEQLVTTTIEGTRSLYPVDMDNDGDIDILAGTFTISIPHSKIAWYENANGLGDFSEEHIIAMGRPASSVHSTDIDNDGDMDVITATTFGKIDWYENIDGLGNFAIFQRVYTDLELPWAVYVADVNGDGDMDVLSVSARHNKVAWHENTGLRGNKIKGFLHFDANQNNCDTLAVPIANILVTSTDELESFASFSFGNGFYQLFPNDGEYSTSVVENIPYYFMSIPAFYISSFTGIGNIDTANFCLTSTEIINDLNIALYPTSEARPGFDASYQVVYHNVGTTQLSGSIKLEFDGTKTTFQSASQVPSVSADNLLVFEFNNLNPFETKTIDITFSIFPPPIVNIDDILNFTASIGPIIGDLTEGDNVFLLNQSIINSFDPNDITVLEGERIFLEEVDKYLHYIIRFQNTGSADAINIKVSNILDDKLDWNSLQLENSSHPTQVEIRDGNDVDFIFNNIHLPDSTANEAGSHGFIAYKVKPKENVEVGDIISSKADIFFDFNAAVETNTAITEIVETVGIANVIPVKFTVYPIPTSGILVVKSKASINQIEIYNSLGQFVLSNTNQSQIDLSTLPQGFYFCKVKDTGGNYGIKKIEKE